jgi:hypothetical protein
VGLSNAGQAEKLRGRHREPHQKAPLAKKSAAPAGFSRAAALIAPWDALTMAPQATGKQAGFPAYWMPGDGVKRYCKHGLLIERDLLLKEALF